MPTNNSLSTETILGSTESLPFTPADKEFLSSYFVTCRRDLGIPLNIGCQGQDSLEIMVEKGVVFFKPVCVPETVMLANLCIGKGFLGGPKACIYAFYSANGEEDWVPLGAYDHLKTVLSVITNLYGRAWEAKCRTYPTTSLQGNGPALVI